MAKGKSNVSIQEVLAHKSSAEKKDLLREAKFNAAIALVKNAKPVVAKDAKNKLADFLGDDKLGKENWQAFLRAVGAYTSTNNGAEQQMRLIHALEVSLGRTKVSEPSALVRSYVKNWLNLRLLPAFIDQHRGEIRYATCAILDEYFPTDSDDSLEERRNRTCAEIDNLLRFI